MCAGRRASHQGSQTQEVIGFGGRGSAVCVFSVVGNGVCEIASLNVEDDTENNKEHLRSRCAFPSLQCLNLLIWLDDVIVEHK